MTPYKIGQVEALNTFNLKNAFYIPLAGAGLATQTIAPFGYGLEGGKTAPKGEGVKRGLTQAGSALLGGILGNVVGPYAGAALHVLTGGNPREAFITAAMMKYLLGGVGSVSGGELARRHFEKKDATTPSAR